jgi:AraC-like DNA-binding protein
MTRTKQRIARDRQELVVVCVQTAGSCLVRQDGRAVLLTPGSMTFLDSTMPSSMEVFGTSSLINVQVQRTWLPGRSLAGVTATEVHGREPGRLVADFLVGFGRLQCDAPTVAAALLPHAVGLVDSVLDVAVRGRTALGSATALAREQIHRFVRQHFHERSLDVASVATACGLSRSSVYRADVAALSGFGGSEQLHRAFRFVAGMTPGAYRMAATTGGGKEYAATILGTASESRLGHPVSRR